MPGIFILWLSAFVFIGYGLVGIANPALPAGFAGLVMSSGDAYAEISSMYGGLQTGLGAFCLLAVMRTEYYRAGLAMLVLGIGAVRTGAPLTASRVASGMPISISPILFPRTTRSSFRLGGAVAQAARRSAASE